MQTIRADLDKDDVKDLYLKVLETILELAKADTEAAKAANLSQMKDLVNSVGKDNATKLIQKSDGDKPDASKPDGGKPK